MVKRDGSQQSSRLIDALKLAHEVLNSVGVRHALIGGIAANLYRREARATQDVDFAVNVSATEAVRLVEAFRKAGWSAEVRGGKAESMRLAHEDLPRVDLLVAGTPFEESAIDRAVKLSIDEQQMLIVTPEDLIVYKLIAGRARDYEAVAAIINTVSKLDRAYILAWLEQFGFADRWIRAEQEARLLAADS